MNSKLPYYMAYPMPLAYDDEKIERRDFEYMKSLYPSAAKKILPYVEEECDRMEYECSMMYDEYPDKLQLRLMCARISSNVRSQEKVFFNDGFDGGMEEQSSDELEGQIQMQSPNNEDWSRKSGRPPHGRHPEGPMQPYGNNQNWLNDMIEIMLYQELYKRRCDNRRCRRQFY